MNNDYDRDATPDHDQMIKAGYEMSGDGFWVPSEGEVLQIEAEDLANSTKLLLLLSGEQVLAQVEENLNGDVITVIDPREVRLEGTTSDGESTTSSVAFSAWLPLSHSRRIDINKTYVVCMNTPIQSLVESYVGEFIDG